MTHQPNVSAALQDEFARQQALFAAQPAIVQRFLEAQAAQLADALLKDARQVRFTLPDRVACELPDSGEPAAVTIPANQREHTIGGMLKRVLRPDIRHDLRAHLNELEQSPDRAISTAAGLLRHATVMHMVHNLLPSGLSVRYQADHEDEIPSIPVDDGLEPESAITASTDAIAEEGQTESGRGVLQTPFVPYARRFYLPQWVAFGSEGKLLVNSVEEAEAHLGSMRRFVDVLHNAVALAAYVSADEEYQKKRYGMLGQMVNQGRALAIYKNQRIIEQIKQRATAGSLNRGLSLTLPYFDDQDLQMATTSFEVIPAGRVMFVPAFVVRAARQEGVKVAQDTRLSPSTRQHRLQILVMFEQAFLPGGQD